jgi:hypothetical protein
LEAAYRARHGSDFDPGDDYALALMNRGGSLTTMIAPRPAVDADHDAAAQRIHAAADAETVYAALMAYGRDSGLVARLEQRYSALFGQELRAQLTGELSGENLAHALYLLGEGALEEQELSPAGAARLFAVMAALTFTDANAAQSPVPFHYPVDGCYARAQMMAQVMTRAGIASARVFAASTVPLEPIVAQSPYAADQPGGAPPVTRWAYHVAPVVGETVIDPSTQPGPVSVDAWLASVGVAAGTYNRFDSFADLQAHLAAPPPPGGEKNVWTTDRNTMFATEAPSPDSGRADAELAALDARMTAYVGLASVHEIAAAVRGALAAPAAAAADVIAAIRGGVPAARAVLWTQFPLLRGDAVARFPDDAAAIDAATGP